MSEQLSIFRRKPTRDELVKLAKDMWHCIQVTPMVPPALKETVEEQIHGYGIEGG